MDPTRPLSRYERILACNEELERLEARIRDHEHEVWRRRGENARIRQLEAATGAKDEENEKRFQENRGRIESLAGEVREARKIATRVHRYVEERLGTTLRNRY